MSNSHDARMPSDALKLDPEATFPRMPLDTLDRACESIATSQAPIFFMDTKCLLAVTRDLRDAHREIESLRNEIAELGEAADMNDL